MENNNNQLVEEMILSGQGLRGLKNKAVTKATLFGYEKVKNHFGFDFNYFNDQAQNAFSIIKKYFLNEDDKGDSDEGHKFNSTFFIKLDKHTYLLFSGKTNMSKEGSNVSAYLYFFGKKSFKYKNKFKKIYDKEYNSESHMTVYNISAQDSGSWICTGNTVASRSFDTLYFDNDISDDIKEFLDTWKENQPIYDKRGLIFKTGILLYGNPGTGKSSIASAIADYLKCDLITIDMTTFDNINISSVVDSINADDYRYVVLLDEIDTIFKSRQEEINENQNNKVTKLLQLLDSVQSPNNVVFVATTNYFDRLDPAVIRKGRFDRCYEIGNFNKETARRMCEGFDLATSITDNILSKYTTGEVNPAKLQTEILEAIRENELLNDSAKKNESEEE